MSACSTALRILSRIRTPVAASSSKTLTPFLYLTPTIQQWTPRTHPITHRNISFRSGPPRREDDVPFEGIEKESSLPPDVDNLEPVRQTTITGSERAAFEKLYKTMNAQKPPRNDLPHAHELDQIADEWYEEDEDKQDDASLDSLFDKVLAGVPAPGQIKRRKKYDNLETLASSVLDSHLREERKRAREAASVEAEKTKAIRAEERARVTALMEQAQTDREVWEILEREVLGVIRQLDLDGTKKMAEEQVVPASPSTKKRKQGKTATAEIVTPKTLAELKPNLKSKSISNTESETEPKPEPTPPTSLTTTTSTPHSRNLFANFPFHLYSCAHILRSTYPSSPLPFSILPTIKSLGRSPFALGASTSLYNLLIRTSWYQYSSYAYVDELLHDMQNAGIEFDMNTLHLLDGILSEFKNARKGEMGFHVKTVWGTEWFCDAARRLGKWRDVVRLRMGGVLERRAREGKLVNRIEGRDKMTDYKSLNLDSSDQDDWMQAATDYQTLDLDFLNQDESMENAPGYIHGWKTPPTKYVSLDDSGSDSDWHDLSPPHVPEDTPPESTPDKTSFPPRTLDEDSPSDTRNGASTVVQGGNSSMDELMATAAKYDKERKGTWRRR
ncbi:hypothetical protein K504DRAFT_465273 [Pleomassaria siparia CBS 279.74]|uniref:Mtf2-like C-terminal domain-containing protein n=1 Tax=Pleomassaria siparia CBS 279.74 TaxID=1314801 RepID=A0A6G1KFG4_9PLEO|nr:hypothetical protein K504DRAFT_465273 [Pleomassaria siparia CBS 279.74]